MVYLEFLPNEILLEVFKYLNAQELFRAFYNLNYRFNELVQSFDYLQLVFHLTKSNSQDMNNEKIFSFHVHTLKVDYNLYVNFSRFRNVRRLKLSGESKDKCRKLDYNNLSHLEQLTIHPSVTYYIKLTLCLINTLNLI
jgi:hypothetical protein